MYNLLNNGVVGNVIINCHIHLQMIHENSYNCTVKKKIYKFQFLFEYIST